MTDPTPPTALTSAVAQLGEHQYGKAEVRLVHVDRTDARHRLTDLTVTSQLRGDFDAIHTHGDNALCVATDSQKNIVYSLARDGVGTPEEFALRLADHFCSTYPQVEGGRWEVAQHGWRRVETPDGPHPHTFERSGSEVRRTVVQRDGDEVCVVSGVTGLTLLKSTGSEFTGYVRDRWTTLPETTDRIMATDVTAWWRYDPTRVRELDSDAAFAAVRATLLERFADQHSLALQQTLWAMGVAVVERHDVVDEIRFSCPNNHHILVDLSPFGQDNLNTVFFAADRPYGLIEATVVRTGAAAQPLAWRSVPAFA